MDRFLYLVGQVYGLGVYLYMEVFIKEALVWTLYSLGMLLLEKNTELRLLMVYAGFGIGLLLTRYIYWISQK
jgi:hypothetical protein